MKQELKATLETLTKKDNSGTYQCVVIQLTPTYSKKVFLESAELELLKLSNSFNLTTSSSNQDGDWVV